MEGGEVLGRWRAYFEELLNAEEEMEAVTEGIGQGGITFYKSKNVKCKLGYRAGVAHVCVQYILYMVHERNNLKLGRDHAQFLCIRGK